MEKIKSLEDLRRIRAQKSHGIKLREKAEMPDNQVKVRVAMATCGIASGAKETFEFLAEALDKRGVEAIVSQTGCMGYCYAEPTIEVTLPGKDPVVFGNVTLERADLIIEKYIKGKTLVDGIIPVNYKTID